jgi:hypothetical protein
MVLGTYSECGSSLLDFDIYGGSDDTGVYSDEVLRQILLI